MMLKWLRWLCCKDANELKRRHDTQHNDTEHDDIQHNDSQHNDIQHYHK